MQLADRSDQGVMFQESLLDTDEEVEENSDSKVIVDRAMDITSQQETLGDESRDDDTGENREDEEYRPRRAGCQTAGKHSNPY